MFEMYHHYNVCAIEKSQMALSGAKMGSKARKRNIFINI